MSDNIGTTATIIEEANTSTVVTEPEIATTEPEVVETSTVDDTETTIVDESEMTDENETENISEPEDIGEPVVTETNGIPEIDIQSISEWTEQVQSQFVIDGHLPLLQHIFKSVERFVRQIELFFLDTGLYIRSMDQAGVAMIIGFLKAEAFSTYTLSQPFFLTVETEKFYGILKSLKNVTSLEIIPGAQITMNVSGKSNKRFTLTTLQPTDNRPNVPDLTFGATITTTTGLFEESISDVKLVEDVVSLIVNEEGATFCGESNSSADVVTLNLIEHNNTSWTLSEGQSQQRGRYSIEYINKFLVGLKPFDTVTIGFGTDYPLRINSVSDGLVNLAYILAPRIEGD